MNYLFSRRVIEAVDILYTGWDCSVHTHEHTQSYCSTDKIVKGHRSNDFFISFILLMSKGKQKDVRQSACYYLPCSYQETTHIILTSAEVNIPWIN